MSDWTEVSDIRKKLEREWERGILLAARLDKEPVAPRRIPLKRPAGLELLEQHDAVRQWAGELLAAGKRNLFEVEMQEVKHRQLGANSLPLAVIFPSEELLFRFVGKQQSVERFDYLCTLLLTDFPELRPWLKKSPLKALAHYDSWPQLLAVLAFLKKSPRPGIYVRQLAIPEVDTKFIEKHKKLLTELLDLVLPKDTIDWDARGVKKFEQRYGFLAKPIQIRFRILDSSHSISGLSDFHVPVDQFHKLHLDIDTVFITENEINGLAFPEVKRAIIIFGLGFGLDRLAPIEWLNTKHIHYWGDIDTHGFVMLDQCRRYFPHACSFLMDKETLMTHRPHWGEEDRPTKRVLTRLLEDEQEVYQLLLHNQFSERLRLEQEKISFRAVEEIVQKFR
ncbi:MAG: hypothetical protein CSB34_02755 [Desulfobulbus propionicus]|nr:MAG: hypothetical protein CSB34_02755 [Desulfobulbus propionicus]